MGGETTPDLLSRFASGDAGAGDALVRRHEVALRRFIAGHVDPAFSRHVSVDDLFQETCLEAFRSLGRFRYRRDLSFFFWLCGIARNLIRAHSRRLDRQPPLVRMEIRSDESSTGITLLTTLRDGPPDAEEALDRVRLVALLASALSDLPPRRRQALLLRHVEGYGADEAAAIMGTTPGAFRILHMRALDELSSLLERLGGRP